MSIQPQQRQPEIPDGYVHIQTEDGQHYLVPNFMILASHQAMDAYRKKAELGVHGARGGVSNFLFKWLLRVADADADADTYHEFAVWKHDRCAIPLLSGPRPADVPCRSDMCAHLHLCGYVNLVCRRSRQTGSCWAAMPT